MNRVRKHQGFSLTEVLIAVGIMAIGLVMVAMVFPVGIKLTALTTERTIGAVAADEAFAKIQLYGLRDFVNWPADPNIACSDYLYVTDYRGPDGTWNSGDENNLENDFLYPSTVAVVGEPSHYHWSALCRRVGAKDVQATVFVTRKIAAASQYRAWDPFSGIATSDWPKPVPVSVDFEYSDTNLLQNKQLLLTDPQPNIFGLTGFDIATCKQFFDDGFTIVDSQTGSIYRILEVDHLTGTLTLQQEWEWIGYPTIPVAGYPETRSIWVVPPAVGSGRYPAVGVYQKVLRFDTIQ